MSLKLFGTNGVRGIANKELTGDMALRLAMSYGTMLDQGSSVAVARDTRLSGEMLKQAVVSGLLSTGCDVVDAGIVPIPALQFYIKDNADGGVMITASHNPWDYNGIKTIDGDGTETGSDTEAEIERIYFSSSFRRAGWSKMGSLGRAEVACSYISGVLKHVNRKKISGAKLRVAADLGNGSSVMTTPWLLRALGVEVITINDDPIPASPGREPEPSRQSLKPLMELVKAKKADFGVAHDCDADRAVFIDEKGGYVDEDVILALFVKHALSGYRGADLRIVTPVSSSQRIVDVAREFGAKIEWTKVGSIHVARKMKAIGAVIGGEGNGGTIFPEHQHCRDAAMSVAKMCELVMQKKLSELAGEIPRYCNLKTKLRCESKEAVMDHIRQHIKAKGEIITVDGFKVYCDDGWLLIRPSGTEPIIRIFVESKSEAKARELLEYGRSLIERG